MKTTDKPLRKNIPFLTSDHERVVALRDELHRQRGSKISISQTFMEAIKLLEEKMEKDSSNG